MTDTLDAVDLPALTGDLVDIAVRPGDAGYSRVRSTYMKTGSPRLILRARNEDDVQAAVRYAAMARSETGRHIPFSIRSGGHGMSGSGTNDAGIVLDLSRLSDIEVIDDGSGLVRIGVGAVWGDVAAQLAQHELVLSSGNFGDAGVGGLATGGGIGFFARSHGLTLDRVTAARVVTADGVLHVVDEEQEPDLFWAVRGGSAKAGVATQLTLRAASLPGNEVIDQQVHHLVDDLADFIRGWGAFMSAAPRELTSNLRIEDGGPGRFIVSTRNVWYGTDQQAATGVLQDYLGLGTVLQQRAMIAPYESIIPTPRWPHQGQQQILIRNGLIRRVDESTGAALGAALNSPSALVGELRSIGGVMNDVDPGATAWGHRDHEAMLAVWFRPLPAPDLDEAWSPVAAVADGLYTGYTSDLRPERAEDAWPGATGDRLREIAGRHDPEGLFDSGIPLHPVHGA